MASPAAAIQPLDPAERALTANILNVMFGGVKVGVVSALNGMSDYSPEPLSGIGDINVKEWVPTMARHTVHVERMVLRKNTLLQLAGKAWENGDKMLDGLMFDIEVSSNGKGGTGGGNVAKKFVKCSFATGGIRVNKHSIVVEDATFYALDAQGTYAVEGDNANTSPTQ